MSDTKWTAGQWQAANMIHSETGERLTPEELGEYVANAVRMRPECTDFLFVHAEKPDGPADICHVGNGPDGPYNAHLIAAAPDLYAALDQAFITLCRIPSGREYGDISGVRNMARAALAKARGES